MNYVKLKNDQVIIKKFNSEHSTKTSILEHKIILIWNQLYHRFDYTLKKD